MKLSSFEIRIVEIPMKMSVEHALAERTVARNILVAAHDTAGHVGWGECCPRDYVTGETIESALGDLKNRILPKLLGQEFNALDEVCESALNMLDTLSRNQQAAFCAAELAMLDLAGHAFKTSAGEVLGPVCHDSVVYSGVVAANSDKGVRTYAALLRQFGVPVVKIKVGADLETNLRFLAIAREVLGEHVELRIDANSAWNAKTAIQQLKAMTPFKLAGVEQPVPGEDIDGMREVTAANLVPVIADESLATMADAERLVERRACDIFNIRISKVGGLLSAGRLHRYAEKAGLMCQLGAQVGEMGLLSAAGRHYGTRCPNVRWFEGSYDSHLLESCITEPDITLGAGAKASALTGVGLGVTPDLKRLEAATTWTAAVA